MRKILGLLVCFLFFIVVSAQQKTIRGKVTDANGSPLSGVTVSVRGQNVATQTANDGSFTITAAQGNTLEFTYVGLEPRQVQIGTGNELSVSMQGQGQGQQLSEVVVTAL